MMRFAECTEKKNKGFTLVELIVVLTILAMLAAMLVPALLGYIDRTRTNADIIHARNCMQAMQTELMDLYAFDRSGNRASDSEGDKSSVFPGYAGVNANKNADIDLRKSSGKKTDYAKKILKTADEDPYLLIIGVGAWGIYEATDESRKAYTCYICMYMKDKDSRPIFFDGERWTTDYPGSQKKGDKNVVYENVDGNIIKAGRKYAGTHIQYYVVAGPSDRGVTGNSIWGWIRDQVKKFK